MRSLQKTQKPVQSQSSPVSKQNGLLQQHLAQRIESAEAHPILYKALNLPIHPVAKAITIQPKLEMETDGGQPGQASPSEKSQENKTGLPKRLKANIESLSGISMNNVRVYYNSLKPIQLQASAYTQGTDIHVAPGQEKHLPHEAWHVVQQMQGRVQPGVRNKGIAINDDVALEREADVMGTKAKRNQTYRCPKISKNLGDMSSKPLQSINPPSSTVQRVLATIDEVDPQNLSAHYTQKDASNTASGRGARTMGGTDLRTNIKWSSLHTSGEGTGVTADPIGPDHPLGRETAANQGIGNRVRIFNDAFKGQWKQGHLLNATLGGDGYDPKNLVAISAKTNSQMSDKFEDELQRRINTNGEWLHFKIEVKHADIENEESQEALKDVVANQCVWAKTFQVSWGAVDDNGTHTGDTKSVRITAGGPVAKEEKKKKAPPTKVGTPKSTPTHNLNSGGITLIGPENVVLDSAKSLEKQVTTKKYARLERQYKESQAAMELDKEVTNLLGAPPSPLTYAEQVDQPMMEKFNNHKPMKDFSGMGGPMRSFEENKKIQAAQGRWDPYAREWISFLKIAKSRDKQDMPQKLGRLLDANAENDKLSAGLIAAREVWVELGQWVESMRGGLHHLSVEDWSKSMFHFYEKDPIKFKEYTSALREALY